jgi:hypothetical protein
MIDGVMHRGARGSVVRQWRCVATGKALSHSEAGVALGGRCRSGGPVSGGEGLPGKPQSLLEVTGKNSFIVHLAADDKAVLPDFLRAKLLVEGHGAVVAAVATDDPLGCLLLDRREKELLHHVVGESRTVQAAVDVELFQFDRLAGGDFRKAGGHGLHVRSQVPEGLTGQLHFRYPALGTPIEIRGDGLRGIALIEEYLEVFGIVKVAPSLKTQESPQLGEANEIQRSSSSDTKTGVTEFPLPLDGSKVDGLRGYREHQGGLR